MADTSMTDAEMNRRNREAFYDAYDSACIRQLGFATEKAIPDDEWQSRLLHLANGYGEVARCEFMRPRTDYSMDTRRKIFRYDCIASYAASSITDQSAKQQ